MSEAVVGRGGDRDGEIRTGGAGEEGRVSTGDSSTPGSDPTADALATLLARTEQALASLAALLAPAGQSPTDQSLAGPFRVPRAAVDHVERLRRLIDAIDARLLPVIDAEGMWSLDGQRSFAAWLEGRTGTSRASATRRIGRGRALRDHLPTTRAQFEAGALDAQRVDHLITTASSPQRIDALGRPRVGEAFLATEATTLTAAQTRVLVRQWAAMADPAAEERAARVAIERCEFTLAPTLGGWHAQGWLDHETGLTLRTALDAATGRPAQGDTRTRGQRDAAALLSLAHVALDDGVLQKGARVRPHLLIHVPLETAERLGRATACQANARGIPGEIAEPIDVDTADSDADTAAYCALAGVDGAVARATDTCSTDALALAAQVAEHTHRALPPRRCGPRSADADADAVTDDLEAVIPPTAPPGVLIGSPPATFDDGTPLSPHQLARFLCDGALTRLIFDSAGEPLDVGRAQRIFTTAQTKAVIARDRHCRYPGCNAPPGWGQIHHALTWARGGATDIGNAILLCWSHHRVVHQLNLSVHRHTDRWEYHTADGHLHGTTPRTGHPRLPGLDLRSA